MTGKAGQGPLAGVRIIELGGIGPGPFCCMLLSDLGAEVVRIDRPPGFDGGAPVDERFQLLHRGRRRLALDLKRKEAVAAILKLAAKADALIEGFRPGVAERLGLGPAECLAANPGLVYGRMTGWGQEGPLAQAPGHDLNYIALTGVAHSIGTEGGAPGIPLNLVGDFGGGSLYLAFGIVSALLERQRSGKGQVVDAAMIDGSASLMTMMYGLRAASYWTDERGTNRLDSGAPYYNVYRTSDGLWLSIACNETRFWRNLLELLELTDMPDQHDRAHWRTMKQRIAAVIARRTRDEWCRLAEGREICLAPVLSMAEAPRHPHLAARGTFVEVEGIPQPAPAPRFSRTPGAIQSPPARAGEHSEDVLRDWGFTPQEIGSLRGASALA